MYLDSFSSSPSFKCRWNNIVFPDWNRTDCNLKIEKRIEENFLTKISSTSFVNNFKSFMGITGMKSEYCIWNWLHSSTIFLHNVFKRHFVIHFVPALSLLILLLYNEKGRTEEDSNRRTAHVSTAKKICTLRWLLRTFHDRLVKVE